MVSIRLSASRPKDRIAVRFGIGPIEGSFRISIRSVSDLRNDLYGTYVYCLLFLHDRMLFLKPNIVCKKIVVIALYILAAVLTVGTATVYFGWFGTGISFFVFFVIAAICGEAWDAEQMRIRRPKNVKDCEEATSLTDKPVSELLFMHRLNFDIPYADVSKVEFRKTATGLRGEFVVEGKRNVRCNLGSQVDCDKFERVLQKVLPGKLEKPS